VFRKILNQREQPLDDAGAELLAVVRQHMPGADDETQRIVYALAGLLITVAYADREFSTQEQKHTAEALHNVQGLEASGVEAILSLLRHRSIELATTQSQRFCRTLREEASHDLRLEILRLLVGLAAVDGAITLDEVARLRGLTEALGLNQDDYNTAQAEHREKITFL